MAGSNQQGTATVGSVGGFKGWIRRAPKRYFIDAMSQMALGLFASLLIGLILQQIFGLISWEPLQDLAELIGSVTSSTSPVVGAAIGVAVAYGLKVKPLVIYSAAAVGAMGYSVSADGISAGPVGAFIAVIIAAELAQAVSGKTKLDILLVPSVALITGGLAALLVGPTMATFMRGLGSLVNTFTQLQPFWMGIAISAIMSFVLFSPLSSAALAIMLGLTGLAAGASTAGCCASMIGFAACSFRENGWGGTFAQGLGTSMLQVGNVARHPIILVPSTLAAAIVGPISTVVFRMENIAYGAGMGTSGLVGVITTWTTMVDGRSSGVLAAQILILYFILPAVLSLGISEIMRKKGWIQYGWMKLDSV